MQVRHKAFFHAMKQNGLRADPSCAGTSFYVSHCIEKHLPRLLDLGMTAIICSHDLIANAAIVQCQQLGVHVPEDISIVGFDDLPISAYTSPPLTTVRQERLELGKCGFYALDSILNKVYIGTMYLHAQLIVRNSTGRPAADAGVSPLFYLSRLQSSILSSKSAASLPESFSQLRYDRTVLPTRTYCSKFIFSPYSEKSFCKIHSKERGSSQRDRDLFSDLLHLVNVVLSQPADIL